MIATYVMRVLGGARTFSLLGVGGLELIVQPDA